MARIELVLEGERSIVVDDEYIAHSLCMEELRAIRLFLRKNGWKPLDEREPA